MSRAMFFSPRGIHAHTGFRRNWQWIVQDGLGSVREVLDNSVGVLESQNYDPYGNAFGATGTEPEAPIWVYRRVGGWKWAA